MKFHKTVLLFCCLLAAAVLLSACGPGAASEAEEAAPPAASADDAAADSAPADTDAPEATAPAEEEAESAEAEEATTAEEEEAVPAEAEEAAAAEESPASEEAEVEPLVLLGGQVVTATGADPIADGAVVIENGLITAVGPVAELTFPEGATMIDVAGRTILPGLIDARTSVLEHLEINEGQLDAVGLEVFLKMPLQAGVTTLRDTQSQFGITRDIAELRTALAAQGNTVPTIVLTGPLLAHPNGAALQDYPENMGVATAAEAREAAAGLIAAGVDQIGFVQSLTDEDRDGTGTEPAPTLSPDQLQAIVDVGHDQGKWVIGQAAFPDEAEIVLAAGVDELANWPAWAQTMPDDLIEALVAQAIPVVSTFNIRVPQEGDVRRFLDAGGTLAFGTYAPNSGPLHSPDREFLVMSLMGMEPMEMIVAATANAAQVVGLGDVVGTLEAGKQADVIVVDGDPFEDFRVMGDVVYVVKGGELVARPEEG